MTDDERFSLLVGLTGASDLWPVRDERIPQGVPMCAGYVPGIPRLGVPALLMSDAGLGVTNPGYRPGDTATALPAGLALAASFNPVLARSSGKAIGREARSRGFNVQLAGAINLARDPRNGRNFEYLSEDPLLSATMAAESIIGIQQQGVIATTKHFSLNCNETNRHWLDAVIDPDATELGRLRAWRLTEIDREGDRQPARRIHLPGHNLRNGLATRLARISGLHDGVHRVAPGHGHRVARLKHHNGIRVGGRDCGDQRILTPWQRQIGAVEALSFGTDREHDRDVCSPRSQHRPAS